MPPAAPTPTLYTPGIRHFDAWRIAARSLLLAGIDPSRVQWQSAGELSGDEARTSVIQYQAPPHDDAAQANAVTAAAHHGTAPSQLRIPRQLLQLLRQLSCHRDPGRWSLMYRLLWRQRTTPQLLDNPADPDVSQAMTMRAAIQRECHKMHAFVRFQERMEGEHRFYYAWYEPHHPVLTLALPFFCQRFANMDWTIATPQASAHWRAGRLQLAGGDTPTTNTADEYEQLWRTYYRNVCNIQRINPGAMQREMPQRYWRNLPEAAEIQPLLNAARTRLAQRQGVASPSPARVRAMRNALKDASR